MELVVKGVQQFAKGQELNVDHKVYGSTFVILNVSLKAKEVVLDGLGKVLLAGLLPRFCTDFAQLFGKLLVIVT